MYNKQKHEKQKAWRQAHREEYNQKRKERRASLPQEEKERRRLNDRKRIDKWRREQPEEYNLKKRQRRKNRIFTVEQKEKRKIRHRAYMKEYKKSHPEVIKAASDRRKKRYKENPELRRAFLDRHTISSIKKRAEVTAWIRSFKTSCSKCGYNKHSEILEFHHPNSKEKLESITKLRDNSREKILAEIKKCIVLCPNCHREIHLATQYHQHI